MTARGYLRIATLTLLPLGGGACGIGNAQARLRSAVDARKSTLDECYAQALERDRNAAGEMVLWIHVAEATGQVLQVDIGEGGMEEVTLQQCVQTALQGVKLQPKPKANLKVEYTLRFAPTT